MPIVNEENFLLCSATECHTFSESLFAKPYYSLLFSFSENNQPAMIKYPLELLRRKKKHYENDSL